MIKITMMKNMSSYRLNSDLLETLGDKSKLIVVWLSVKGKTTITQLTKELRIPLTTVAHIIPELVSKNLLTRSGDVIKASERLQESVHT